MNCTQKICIVGLVGWVLLGFGCSRTPDFPSPPPLPATFNGFFILNEGQWTRNDATLDYYAPADGFKRYADVFQRVNGTALGDVAQSVLFDHDTLFIVINNSRLVYKVQMPQLKLLATLSLPVTASPRRMVWLNTHKAYINSLLDGTIYTFDPSTMKLLPNTISAENYMEDLFLTPNGHLLATNGNYAYPAANNKLTVIDVNTDKVLRVIPLPEENPGPIAQLPDGRLIVGCRASIFSPTSKLVVLDPQAQTIDTVITMQGRHYKFTPSKSALYIVADSGICKLTYPNLQLHYNYISRSTVEAQPQDLLYSVWVDSTETLFAVTNAGRGAVNGQCIFLDAHLRITHKVETGLFPGTVFMYP